MSGQPNRYVKDVANFRNDYMEALGLRASLDDMNLQANKQYKDTGSLPPQSTLKDMRTTPEILADTEKLKLSLIAELKPVCSTGMAQLVVQRVQQSPLNADGSFLVWFAQNAPELVMQLKKKYKFGIAGNDNDAEQLVAFLTAIFSKTKDMNSNIKSAFDRPTGSDSIGSNPNDFTKLKILYDEIYFKLVSLISDPSIVEVRDQMDILNRILNTPPNRYELIRQKFRELSEGTNSRQQLQINLLGYQKWIEFTDKLPSPSILRTLLDQLKKSLKNANQDLTIKIIQNIKSIIPSIDESVKIYQITENILHITEKPPVLPDVGRPRDDNDFGGNPTYQPPPTPIIINDDEKPDVTGKPYGNAEQGNFSQLSSNNAKQISTTALAVIYDDAIANVANRGLPFPFSSSIESQIRQSLVDRGLTVNTKYKSREMRKAIERYTHDDIDYVLNKINGKTQEQFVRDELSEFNDAAKNTSMVGFGLKKKRIGRPKGSGVVKPLQDRIDHTKGIKQGHIHVPFGKYILNKNKLDSDQVYFKHTKGYGVKGFPMTKVSKKLGHVLRTIIGGGVPKFEELNDLSEQEKEYLHKIANKAGIMDKLSIPAPSKDKLEQDIHQFELMKGEIMSGNDSPELIKKFKLILLRLSKNGTLPKREASELMEELIQLGY